MRRKLIAGNWKMYKTVPEALALVRDLKARLNLISQRDIVVAPPYTALWAVANELQGSNIGLGAQELFPEFEGAYTGAVSGPMLRDAGCAYVIVAHSERRALFGETLESSQKRVMAALKHGLTPIFCVGETLEQREAGQTHAVVAEQLEAGIAGLTLEELGNVVIAYEPVWAIGTGRVATPEQAQDVHAFIRGLLMKHSEHVANSMRILYGGSVKPNNAKELLEQPDIDGALVGGASLEAETFAAIVTAGMPSSYEDWFDVQFQTKK